MPSKDKTVISTKVSFRRADDVKRFAAKNGLTVNGLLAQFVDVACLGGVTVENGEIVIHGNENGNLDTTVFERRCRNAGRDPQQTLDFITEQM